MEKKRSEVLSLQLENVRLPQLIGAKLVSKIEPAEFVGKVKCQTTFDGDDQVGAKFSLCKLDEEVLKGIYTCRIIGSLYQRINDRHNRQIAMRISLVLR